MAPRASVFLALLPSLALGIPAGAVLVRRGGTLTATIELPPLTDDQIADLERAGVITATDAPIHLRLER